MDPIIVRNISVLNSDCRFTDPFQFEIQFECLQPLTEDLEWRVIYVGSAASEAYDQELDSVMVGPLAVGESKFVLEVCTRTNGPDPARIPKNELIGVTVLLVTCSYRGAEFTRVGYYVNNDFESAELRENPPAEVEVGQLARSVLSSKPHVTHFTIPWDGPTPAAPAPVPEPAADSHDASCGAWSVHGDSRDSGRMDVDCA